MNYLISNCEGLDRVHYCWPPQEAAVRSLTLLPG